MSPMIQIILLIRGIRNHRARSSPDLLRLVRAVKPRMAKSQNERVRTVCELLSGQWRISAERERENSKISGCLEIRNDKDAHAFAA